MSIFDSNLEEKLDWKLSIQNAEKQNPMLEGHSSAEYYLLFDVYYQIRHIYQTFFTQNWHYDAETASKNVNAKYAEIGESREYHFTDEQFETLRDCVANLQVPDKFSLMLDFVHRVATFDLEFLCLYPVEGKIAKTLYSRLPQEWLFNNK